MTHLKVPTHNAWLHWGYTRAIERMWLWSIRLQVRRVFIKKSTVRFWSETHALFQASNGLRDSNKETLVRANRWKIHAVLCLTDSFVTCPLEPGHKEEYLFPKIMPRQSPYVFPTPCSWANFWVSFSILFVMISLKLYSKAFFLRPKTRNWYWLISINCFKSKNVKEQEPFDACKLALTDFYYYKSFSSGANCWNRNSRQNMLNRMSVCSK